VSATVLAALLLVPLGLLALGLNHLLARVGLVEFALSQGRPQRPSPLATTEPIRDFDTQRAAALLPPDSVSVFVSATCVACARLIDDLAAPDLTLPFDLDLFFADRRSPLARRGQLHEDQADLFGELAVPVTPYAVLTRAGTVAAHGGVADIDALGALIDWQLQPEPVGSSS